jgi:acid phosphatase (class A)
MNSVSPLYSPVLTPVLTLIAWTLVMWLWMYATRIPAIRAAGIKLDSELPKGEQMNLLPPEVRWKADNYNHLLEQPTIFYALALSLALMGEGHGANLWLAWAYVGLRIIHSVFQALVNKIEIRFLIFVLSTLMLFGMVFNAFTAEAVAQPAPVEEIRPGRLPGYLPEERLPNALALIPPSPAQDSAAFAWEQDVNQKIQALRGGPRWQLATLDNDLTFPNAAGTFSCALDVPITQEHTPYLYQLLRRTLLDAGLATYSAKNHYQRTRPFVVNGQSICAAGSEETLRNDGSYPSGHTAIGWAWALILSEIAPDRANELQARGLAFGDSRMVCNVHWPMDVIQGQNIGAATVAVLQSDALFRSDLEGAKAEVAAVRARGLPPTRDCAVEAEAMAVVVPR